MWDIIHNTVMRIADHYADEAVSREFKKLQVEEKKTMTEQETDVSKGGKNELKNDG